MLKRLFLIACLLFPSVSYAVTLTEEQQQAKQKGMEFFMQRYSRKAQPLLEPAAKAGDIEAQYYLAEAMRQANFANVTKEAYYWYEQAAKQGDLYAMIQLASSHDYCELFESCTYTPKQWAEKARTEARARAEKGDSEAMGLMYTLSNGDISWLEKAANAGNGYYQNLLAKYYLDGNGWFLNYRRRKQAYDELIEKAAKSGYVPAMYNYGGFLAKQGHIKEGQEWVLRAVNAGDIMTTKSYAIPLIDEEFNQKNIFQFPMDYIKGYALLSLVAKNGGGDGNTAEFYMKQAEKHMTPEQITQAKAYAEEWKKTHPPLSYFTPKLGLF